MAIDKMPIGWFIHGLSWVLHRSFKTVEREARFFFKTLQFEFSAVRNADLITGETDSSTQDAQFENLFGDLGLAFLSLFAVILFTWAGTQFHKCTRLHVFVLLGLSLKLQYISWIEIALHLMQYNLTAENGIWKFVIKLLEILESKGMQCRKG